MKLREIKTPTLHLAYEESGPKSGEPLLLVHGWPDSPRTWDGVLPRLHEGGYRTIAPYLRGYGPTRFRDPLLLGRKPRRTGQPVAFAQDMIDLADRLEMKQFHFVGHDWGARTAHALAALFPKRLKRMVTIAVPFEPVNMDPPKFAQAHAYWYQWMLCTHPGEQKFRADPVAFGHAQWQAWSPEGWYSGDELAEAAKSWTGEDFKDVVLHSYRSRWGHAAMDPKYADLQEGFESTKTLDVPTMLIHGEEDHCTLSETTDGAERHFTAPYERVLLKDVGHFAQREAPERTAEAILRWLATA